jgi:N-acetylmuramidase-like protein/putative peptidoglycan binding protein
MVDFAGPGTPLSPAGVDAASGVVDVGLPELWSVVSVETSGCGFLPDRRPKILFERHYFSRLTGHKFDADNPDVSQPSQGGYGAGGAHQHDRLAAAIQLDRTAALRSASWGLGQIMGDNWKAAGFEQVEDMVTSMVASEDNQLAAMAAFIKASGMDQPLRRHDWEGFARRYNGANFAANQYDKKLQQFFERYAAGPTPDLRVRGAQIYLIYKGFSPGAVDGVAGKNTASAVRAFQASIGLEQTGIIDDALMERLAA